MQDVASASALANARHAMAAGTCDLINGTCGIEGVDARTLAAGSVGHGWPDHKCFFI